ncbi:MAG: flagellar motor switch protein FliG [Steroidobacteraceae bacterium]|nr:flagellar motor switch protein FliG [Steroidobacteraceae bacterium]MDW8260100.1 flagellar motor switch protein FliG [Gammaproteobacteria bacterium]
MAEAAAAASAAPARPAAPAARAAPARDGTERAAILLLTLGEKEAAEVLRYLDARDVQRVGAAMARIGNITRADVIDALAALQQHAEGQTSLGVGSDEFVRKALIGALGEERAANVIDRILNNRAGKGLDSLKWLDGKTIAEMIKLEHPQTIAIILAYLDPEHSAAVIAHLPESVRPDIVMRIATLDGVQPSALRELDRVIETQFSAVSGARTAALGGPKCAADIINHLDPAIESTVMEQLRKADETLTAQIEDLLFVFENLLDIDDRGMQELLRQVPSDKLLLALKGADQPLKDKVFKNMSQRAAEMLKDDLESRGPVKLSEVEAAQKEILQAARKLAESGAINLGGKGEQYV